MFFAASSLLPSLNPFSTKHPGNEFSKVELKVFYVPPQTIPVPKKVPDHLFSLNDHFPQVKVHAPATRYLL